MSSVPRTAKSNGAPPAEVFWNRVDDEVLMLDTRTGDYFSLNPVATDIWMRLIAGETHDEIVAATAQTWDVEEAQVARDVAELIADLRDAELWT